MLNEIYQLISRYNLYGDGADAKRWLTVFTADPVLEIYDERRQKRIYRGREQLEELFSIAVARGRRRSGGTGGGSLRAAPKHVRHHVTTAVIESVEDNLATGEIYFLVLRSHGLDHWGRYKDVYARQNERWLIQRRVVYIDGRPTDQEARR